jgi:hypothetical protein
VYETRSLSKYRDSSDFTLADAAASVDGAWASAFNLLRRIVF